MRAQMICVAISLAVLATLGQSSTAEHSQHSSIRWKINWFLNSSHQYWMNYFGVQSEEDEFNLSPSLVLAGVCCFIASSISSAGGIGGGGLYIPIMTIIAGFDLKTASCFSAFMVTGGSIANVLCNLLVKNPKPGDKPVIDFDLALLLQPCMLLGVSVGVICNIVFPNWLNTTLFAVFLGWSTIKTCKNGIFYWKLESEMANINGSDDLEDGSATDSNSIGNNRSESAEEPLIENNNRQRRFPWTKLAVLLVIWFLFFAIYLFRGNKYGEGIISIEPCGAAYWILSSLQIPLAIAFTVWICSKTGFKHQFPSQQQDEKNPNPEGTSNTENLIFPLMSLLAGILGGLFGIGGGMLISPLLLQFRIAPEVTAATCSFMVFFSSTMSAIQYLLLGMAHTEMASIFAIICFIASLLGLVVVQRAITEYGRASIIVFSVGIVMALSTVLMTSFGALDVWNDYASGNNVGFKWPC